eukprot:TRINITY_DN2227_c0_g3_i1.p1 TRINITY_DN2227_c0_g3~~TRINITY_DN2227_c0_g3_i1.p1  ORF type:complete len:298 (-),score=27.67 TRINITY_DN2227_c0_g3_i1:810-1703(-)
MESPLNYWVQVVVNEDMVHILDVSMAKLLSLVSHSFSNTVKRFIEDNFYFFMVGGRRFSFYQPKNIKNVSYIEQINAPIRAVKFSDSFNLRVDLSAFTNLTHIQYGMRFNQPIENKLIPPNLTNLSFNREFNQAVSGLIFNKLTHLSFGEKFNLPLDGLIAPKLTHLELGYYFNCRIDNLPLSLTHLTLGSMFIQPINGILPPNIKFLELGFSFNRTIDILPPALTHLTLGYSFSLPIQTLPPLVKQVLIKGSGFEHTKFNHPVSHLNPSIKFLFTPAIFKGPVEPYKYRPKLNRYR